MKTLYRLLLYLALTSILRAESSGDAGIEVPRISLREVTSVVLANNPSIKEAENRWHAARERVRQANAWDDPRIGGELFYDMIAVGAGQIEYMKSAG